jgi:cell division protein FtsI (penicillin-binding protein 3)
MAIICIKAIDVQVFKSKWLSQKASKSQRVVTETIGKRGTIYDKNNKEMAVSIYASSIIANPQKIKKPDATAKKLSKALMVDEEKTAKLLSSNKQFVWIKRKATPKEIKNVKGLNIDGIEFMPEYKRYYPFKTLAGQLVGFTGIDDQGLEGLEYYYNEHLKSTVSKSEESRDALGRIIASVPKNSKEFEGKNIVLTIDINIQHFVETALQSNIEKYSAKSGIAIVMETKTGAILALAHYPLFNPNVTDKKGQRLWRNRAITDSYEPGSTMKIFTAAAAIESSSSSIDSIFYCENGSYQIGKHVIHDTKKYNWLTLKNIIKYSSNIGTVKISTITGTKNLYDTFKKFGFSSKTGIDYPGETTGKLSPYKKWTKIDAANISFGQGLSVSAIQLISATSAIANGGILMKPYIAHSITDKSGHLIKRFSPTPIRRVISESTARIIKDIMETVTEEGGTGRKAGLNGYSAAGKTGTAQKINNKGMYSNVNYISSFVGFAPVEKPKITVLVIIDEPRKEHYGGVVAAPVFRKITQQTLDYINSPP